MRHPANECIFLDIFICHFIVHTQAANVICHDFQMLYRLLLCSICSNVCVGKVYEAESAFQNKTFLHSEPSHLLHQLRIEKLGLGAINVSVKTSSLF